MDDKELIRATAGVLTAVYKGKQGHKANGDPYSIQNATLKDNTGSITLFIKDREEDIPLSWRGKRVIIEAYESDRGYVGVYAHDDTYKMDKGKSETPERMIRTTKTAQIYLENEAEGKEREPEPPPKKAASTAQSAPPEKKQREAAPPQTKEELEAVQHRAVLTAKKNLAKAANLYCLALDVVDKVIGPHWCELTGDGHMPLELVQQAVGSVFITARDKSFEVASLPVKPIEAPPPTDAIEPQRADSPPPRGAPPPIPPINDDDDEIPF